MHSLDPHWDSLSFTAEALRLGVSIAARLQRDASATSVADRLIARQISDDCAPSPCATRQTHPVNHRALQEVRVAGRISFE
jgi:hypothetical protein